MEVEMHDGDGLMQSLEACIQNHVILLSYAISQPFTAPTGSFAYRWGWNRIVKSQLMQRCFVVVQGWGYTQ